MKKHNCDSCNKEIEIPDNYEPEYCCEGYECGCYGYPINPMFCDECLELHFGKPVEVQGS